MLLPNSTEEGMDIVNIFQMGYLNKPKRENFPKLGCKWK
jgi:hypothetical protein